MLRQRIRTAHRYLNRLLLSCGPPLQKHRWWINTWRNMVTALEKTIAEEVVYTPPIMGSGTMASKAPNLPITPPTRQITPARIHTYRLATCQKSTWHGLIETMLNGRHTIHTIKYVIIDYGLI